MDQLVAEASAVAARLGDPRWIARCEQWAGALALRRLDLDGAIEHGRAALRIARDLRDDTLLAHTAMFLAPLTQQMPELVADVPTMDEVLVLVRRAGLTESEVWVLPMLVDDLVSAGELERASDLTIDALELIGDRPHSAATVINLVAGVHLAAALGEDEAAAPRSVRSVDRWPRSSPSRRRTGASVTRPPSPSSRQRSVPASIPCCGRGPPSIRRRRPSSSWPCCATGGRSPRTPGPGSPRGSARCWTCSAEG